MTAPSVDNVNLTTADIERVADAADASRRIGARIQIAKDLLKGGGSRLKQWLAARAEWAPHITPETAEVTSIMVLTLDPYGIHPEMPEEFRQIGREYFARAPDSEVWVWFGDLLDATRDALWDGMENPRVIGAGGFIEVRTSEHKEVPYLILRPHHRSSHPFGLTWNEGLAVTFLGWCWGHEGKQAAYWSAPHGGEPAFFVPVTELRAPSDLRQVVDNMSADGGA